MKFKPYPNMKDTCFDEVTRVPAHWQCIRIKYVFRERDERTETGTETLFSLSKQHGLIARDKLTDKEARADTLEGYKHFYRSDLVMNKMQAWNGIFGFSEGETGLVTPEYTVLQPVVEIAPRFFTELFRTSAYIAQFAKAARGMGTAFLRLNTTDLGAIFAFVPPLQEQLSIDTFLRDEVGKVDALLRTQKHLIELLQEKRQALISHVVTKGLDPNVPMKDSGTESLGIVPCSWAVKRLKFASPQVTVGIVVEPSKYYVVEGIPCFRSLNVQPLSLSTNELVFISEESNQLHSKSILRTGDLVAVRTGQPGTTAVVSEEFNNCNCIDLLIIRRSTEFRSRFLAYFLNSACASRQYAEGSGGAIQQHFNVETAKNLAVALPSIGEQDEILMHLDETTDRMDTIIAGAEKSIALLQEHRSALISAAVTGKIDVRNVVNGNLSTEQRQSYATV